MGAHIRNAVLFLKKSGDLDKIYYTYKITRNGKTVETQDPYSVATGVNGQRSMVLGIINTVCKLYTTIIRGTPMMVQLLIMYYIILVALDNKILVAVIAFGLNSAAYVAEIVRSGIMSVDEGQFEAGRSLGLNYTQTMRLIILPQAFKNVLPALANEFITLLKETSISGYIAIPDLTKGGDIIRSQTYDAFLPLFGVAVIYLVLVMILTAGVHKLETRLRTNER